MRIQEFDYSVDVLGSVLWQYNDATNLISLLTQKNAWYLLYQGGFWNAFHDGIFDLITADLFGAAIWSIILNVPLYVVVNEEPSDKPLWGYNAFDPTYPDLLNSYLNFEHSNFSTRGLAIELSLEEQRFLLRLRYFQLSTLTNIAGIDTFELDPAGNYSINTFLNYLCSTSDINYSGTIYVLDNLDMTMTYVFTAVDFPVSLFNALVDLDIFPRPAGVGIKFIVNTGTIWGFGSFNQNFENGNFINEV